MESNVNAQFVEEEIIPSSGNAKSLKDKFMSLEKEATRVETSSAKMTYVPKKFTAPSSSSNQQSKSAKVVVILILLTCYHHRNSILMWVYVIIINNNRARTALNNKRPTRTASWPRPLRQRLKMARRLGARSAAYATRPCTPWRRSRPTRRSITSRVSSALVAIVRSSKQCALFKKFKIFIPRGSHSYCETHLREYFNCEWLHYICTFVLRKKKDRGENQTNYF